MLKVQQQGPVIIKQDGCNKGRGNLSELGAGEKENPLADKA